MYEYNFIICMCTNYANRQEIAFDTSCNYHMHEINYDLHTRLPTPVAIANIKFAIASYSKIIL